MAITSTTPYIPATTHSGVENIANNSEPLPNSQKLETVQVQKTRDHPQENSIKEFISQGLITFTTLSSAVINMISAPIRLFDDNNPIKKIINQISMFFTKLHLGAYSVAGLISATEQKNPFLVFSFFTEGVAAFMGLRNIYLFRGIATGIDGAVAGIKDKYKKSTFTSYAEGWKHSIDAVKTSFNEFRTSLSKGIGHVKLDGNDIAIFASLIASCGGIMGMTINEKVGGLLRDVAGAVGDYGIFKLDNPTARSAGFFYLAGSILDIAARIFNKGIASILGVKNSNAFERLRDAFHECAIAFDRAGQFFFLRYNQQNDEHLQTKTRDDHQGYLDFMKLRRKAAQEPNLGAELAKARNYATAA
jgi:hypothetical protein